MRQETLKRLHTMASYVLSVLAICICLSYLYFIDWVTDLFTHFQLQYFIGSLVLGLWFFIFKFYKKATLAALFLSISTFNIFTSFNIVESAKEPTALKVMQYNRVYALDKHSELLEYIHSEKPDVVIVQEARQSHSEALHSLSETYPYQIHEPRGNAFGMVAISRVPFKEQTVIPFPKIYFDNILIHFVIEPHEGHVVSIYALHPPPPLKSGAYLQRNSEIKVTAELIREDASQNIIMLGDWNLTPYSPLFKTLLKETGLKHQHTSWPVFQTWPSPFYFPFLQLPIDHILHKGDLQLVEKKRGPAMGSDHYPVVATYALSAHNN